MMHGRSWQETFRRILTNPTLDAIAVILVITLAVYILLDTDSITHTPHMPVLSGR